MKYLVLLVLLTACSEKFNPKVGDCYFTRNDQSVKIVKVLKNGVSFIYERFPENIHYMPYSVIENPTPIDCMEKW